MTLQTSATAETLLSRFKVELPSRNQEEGERVIKDFSTVLSIVSRIIVVRQVMARAKVREVQEADSNSSSSRSAKRHQIYLKRYSCQKMSHLVFRCLKKKALVVRSVKLRKAQSSLKPPCQK